MSKQVEPINYKSLLDNMHKAKAEAGLNDDFASSASSIAYSLAVIEKLNELIAAHNEQEEKIEQILRVLPKKT